MYSKEGDELEKLRVPVLCKTGVEYLNSREPPIAAVPFSSGEKLIHGVRSERMSKYLVKELKAITSVKGVIKMTNEHM